MRRLLARPGEMRELAPAQLALLAAQCELWRRPVGRLVTADGVQAPTVPAAPRPDVARRDAQRLAVAVRRAAAYGLFRPKCLARAIALHRMLERRGIRGSRVRVGVRRGRGTFAAHAWVELHGAALGEEANVPRRYAPLDGMRIG